MVIPVLGTQVPMVGTQTAFGGGTIDVGSGATVAVSGSVHPGVVVAFQDGANDLLRLGGVSSSQPREFAGTIAGFVPGDTIDLPGIPSGQLSAPSFSGGTLTISFQLGTVTTTFAKLAFAGSYQSSSFSLSSDGSGGTALVTCLAAGTRISTEGGNVAVEDLREGDLIRVREGVQPAVWIGHRHVNCSRHPEPHKVWPVRISAGAFGNRRPRRDLWLSPDHAVFANDVLIPVKYLINDRTIVQVPVDEVIYYHVELPRHDVVLAEGLPVESYLHVGDRSNFDNGGGPVALYPDFASRTWEAEGCAPLVVTGPAVDAARRWIAARRPRLQRRRAEVEGEDRGACRPALALEPIPLSDMMPGNTGRPHTMRIRQAIFALVAIVLALPASADSTQGITDTTIKIGNIGPFSGPASVFTPLNYGPEAYLRYINDAGRRERPQVRHRVRRCCLQRGEGHRRGQEADLRGQGLHDHGQPVQRRRHGDQADAGAGRRALDRRLRQSEDQHARRRPASSTRPIPASNPATPWRASP